MRFQGCEHATSLDLAKLNGAPLTPSPESEEALLLQAKGHAHEAEFLKSLKQQGKSVIAIPAKAGAFDQSHEATIEAMKSGADVVYQGALKTGVWQGYSDFLEKTSTPSRLGPFSYEAADTKLKRRADPKHALQLAIYSRAIEEIQGLPPVFGHVELGDGRRASFPVADVAAYAANLSRRLEGFVQTPWTTTPEPSPACDLCRWRDHCAEEWKASDSLVAVAGITKSQRRKLIDAGVGTLRQLAELNSSIPKLHPNTLGKLKTQARLQDARRNGGPPSYELLPIEEGRGLARLPEPHAADLFFDMEGDPLVDGGLEYLFGVYSEISGAAQFKPWWAHNKDEERAAAEAVLTYFADHVRRNPGAHIYHYNHYEVTALKRLALKYGVGEAQLDHLLRAKAFVDLYRIVQQGLIASEPGYSIKDLEAFYRPKRDGEVATASASIIAYERWIETRDQKILDDIAAYNEVDCQSTKQLRDWIVDKVRPQGLPWFKPAEIETPKPEDDPERTALIERMRPFRSKLGEDLADLVVELNAFHKRKAKPEWWEYFDRQDRDTAELIDDLESIGGLTAVAAAQGTERDYIIPAQQTKLRRGKTTAIRGKKGNATIVTLDRPNLRIRVKFPKALPPPDQVDLIPAGPLDSKTVQAAVRDVTASLIAQGFAGSAIADYLCRRPPLIKSFPAGAPLPTSSDIVADVISAVRGLDHGCLPIQGPPGTGKTFVSAAAIVDLVATGRRVAVMSNSHKAINNLLDAVAERARSTGQRMTIAKKISDADDAPDDPTIAVANKNEDPILRTANVVGGTVWLFSRPEHIRAFSHLVIDEAGQVSIADLVAASRAASNIVLVGDQMQLPQPIQGIHPGNSALSCLEYLLDGVHAIQPERGIFLPKTRRLHPTLCKLVSELFYDGRLTHDPATERLEIRYSNATDLPPAGLAFIEIAHEGNSQESPEEADALVKRYNDLLGSRFVDREGRERTITVDDILVVAPYNAQVNLLADRLPTGARVGTVDRFQGQEAPACLISMATSSQDDMPRDIAFLLSLNRMNVAISRAQAVAAIFCSPRLLDAACTTLEEVRQVNALCAIKAAAGSDRR